MLHTLFWVWACVYLFLSPSTLAIQVCSSLEAVSILTEILQVTPPLQTSLILTPSAHVTASFRHDAHLKFGSDSPRPPASALYIPPVRHRPHVLPLYPSSFFAGVALRAPYTFYFVGLHLRSTSHLPSFASRALPCGLLLLLLLLLQSFATFWQFLVALLTLPLALTLSEAFSPHTMDTPFIMGVGGAMVYAIIKLF